MTNPGLLEDVSVQAAFNAAWDLLSRWRRGQRLPARSYEDILGANVFAMPLMVNMLVGAEKRARLEAGMAPPAEGYGWMAEVLPGRAEVLSQLDQLFEFLGSGGGAAAASTSEFPYLEQPTVSGDLGQLGDYRVIREIGHGGMGVVFEVENRILNGERRALKVLEPSRDIPESWTRFVKEARSMNEVKDTNVVRVNHAGQANGVTFIDMEYIYGPTLYDLICHHLGAPVPLALAADLIRQIASGLAAAHECSSQIVHRDVKPGNILLEWMLEDECYRFGWKARVCDFGLAAGVDQTQITHKSQMVGTTSYLSPEQIIPQPDVDGRRVSAKSDVFALGIVAYELTTGRHPFKGDTKDGTTHNIVHCREKPPREVNGSIPKGFDQLVVRMLEKSPGKRPEAREVAMALSNLLGFEAAPTKDLRPAGNHTSSKRATKVHGRWPVRGIVVVFGATIVLLSIIVYAIHFWTPKGDRYSGAPEETDVRGDPMKTDVRGEPEKEDTKIGKDAITNETIAELFFPKGTSIVFPEGQKRKTVVDVTLPGQTGAVQLTTADNDLYFALAKNNSTSNAIAPSLVIRKVSREEVPIGFGSSKAISVRFPNGEVRDGTSYPFEYDGKTVKLEIKANDRD